MKYISAAFTIAVILIIFAFSLAMTAGAPGDVPNPRWNDPSVVNGANDLSDVQNERLGG